MWIIVHNQESMMQNENVSLQNLMLFTTLCCVTDNWVTSFLCDCTFTKYKQMREGRWTMATNEVTLNKHTGCTLVTFWQSILFRMMHHSTIDVSNWGTLPWFFLSKLQANKRFLLHEIDAKGNCACRPSSHLPNHQAASAKANKNIGK